jgi:hypothetical protein
MVLQALLMRHAGWLNQVQHQVISPTDVRKIALSKRDSAGDGFVSIPGGILIPLACPACRLPDGVISYMHPGSAARIRVYRCCKAPANRDGRT